MRFSASDRLSLLITAELLFSLQVYYCQLFMQEWKLGESMKVKLDKYLTLLLSMLLS